MLHRILPYRMVHLIRLLIMMDSRDTMRFDQIYLLPATVLLRNMQEYPNTRKPLLFDPNLVYYGGILVDSAGLMTL